MFIIALFRNARHGKQPGCPSVGEQGRQTTVRPYNGRLSATQRWNIKPPKDILGPLSAYCWAKEAKLHNFNYNTSWKKDKYRHSEKDLRLFEFREGKGNEQVEHRGFLGQWNYLYDNSDRYMTLCICENPQYCTIQSEP